MLCTATLTWAPIDGETGFREAERTEHCRRDAGHDGFHMGEGGIFGPCVHHEPTPDHMDRSE